MATSGPRHILQVVVTSCCRHGSVRMCSHSNTSTLCAVCKTTPQALLFSDHHRAFQHKSTWELLRALLILRACGSNFLVDNSLKILRKGQQIFGDQILGLFLHPTVYSQFVAGEESSDLAVTAKSLQKMEIRLMVAPTLEEDVGESSLRQDKYDKNLNEMFRLAEMTHCHGGVHPCLQTKITALRNLSHIYVKKKADSWRVMVQHMASAMLNRVQLPDIPGINHRDIENMSIALGRFRQLGEVAATKNLCLLVDAEYSYVNPGCSLVALAMMAVFNQNRPVVANTYQCYFKGALETLTLELDVIESLGACFAAKLVRGAYLERERELDTTNICASYAETGDNYHRVLEHALMHAKKAGSDRCLVIIATHNEETVRHSASRLLELGLDPKAGHVVFAQIYGMAEQITMPLVHAGYLVYKSVPMGTLSQVLPYLARRAAENRSVLHGARKERELLQQELSRRLRSMFQR
ncbi:hydroxyproline dehydrogenase isoform X2 [Cryptotermes secundus]|uniref:hydroxyproline dehydrogenase isoform X2 n=1 Tax=Cryptotermes secundus TaxID=105785 RepID=UPI000CD7DB52|nr:hydroxyproline dehydrogenase isoform X2 [Cryptotermes secundus]